MFESLLRVGLAVGTTTTPLIVSRLTVQHQSACFAVPEMQITERHVVSRPIVYFTSLLG